MIKKFINEAYLEAVIVTLLAIFALSRWHWGIDQVLGLILAIVSLVFWVRPNTAPEIYSKVKYPAYIFPLLCALGFVIATHFFSFYLLFVVLAMLQYLRVKKELV